MSYRILTYIGTALIIASCALFTGDRVIIVIWSILMKRQWRTVLCMCPQAQG